MWRRRHALEVRGRRTGAFSRPHGAGCRRCLLLSSKTILLSGFAGQCGIWMMSVQPCNWHAFKDSRLPAPLLILQHRLAAEGEHEAVENGQVRTGRPWDLIAFRKLVDRVLPADKVEKVQDGRRLSEPWRRAVAVRPGTAMFHASETAPVQSPQASADRRVDSDCHNNLLRLSSPSPTSASSPILRRVTARRTPRLRSMMVRPPSRP